jgi:hypothetical protein
MRGAPGTTPTMAVRCGGNPRRTAYPAHYGALNEIL